MAQDHEDALAMALDMAAVSRNLEQLGWQRAPVSIVGLTPGPMTNRTAIGEVPREIVDNEVPRHGDDDDMPDLVDTRDDWRIHSSEILQIPWREPIAPGGIPRTTRFDPYRDRDGMLFLPFDEVPYNPNPRVTHRRLPRPALQLPDDDALAAADEEACCVCLERVPRAMFAPCGHVCVCMRCVQAPSITACPLCRKAIDAIERLVQK